MLHGTTSFPLTPLLDTALIQFGHETLSELHEDILIKDPAIYCGRKHTLDFMKLCEFMKKAAISYYVFLHKL